MILLPVFTIRLVNITKTKIKVMIIEFNLNRLEGDWWFELGISIEKTEYHPSKKMVLTIALAFASVYVRW